MRLMRRADELVTPEDDAWPEIEARIDQSELTVEVLPGDPHEGRACLEKLGITTASPLGAVVYHTGGLLIDHGWTRLLGGTASGGLPGLAEANGLISGEDTRDRAPSLLVGWDVLGGAILVNGSDAAALRRPGKPGAVQHFHVDHLDWSGVGERNWKYGKYLAYLLSPFSRRMNEFDRWPGWEGEVEAVPLDCGLSVYPFPWSTEAREDMASTSRRPVAIAELFSRHGDFARRREKTGPGPLGVLA